jgi:hypothetical protein
MKDSAILSQSRYFCSKAFMISCESVGTITIVWSSKLSKTNDIPYGSVWLIVSRTVGPSECENSVEHFESHGIFETKTAGSLSELVSNYLEVSALLRVSDYEISGTIACSDIEESNDIVDSFPLKSTVSLIATMYLSEAHRPASSEYGVKDGGVLSTGSLVGIIVAVLVVLIGLIIIGVMIRLGIFRGIGNNSSEGEAIEANIETMNIEPESEDIFVSEIAPEWSGSAMWSNDAFEQE